MVTISRRDVIRASAVSLAAPLLPSFGGSYARAQTVHGKVEPEVSAMYPPLMAYVNDRLLTTVAKLRDKTAQRSDLEHAASSMHLLANHFDATGFDRIVKTAAPHLSPAAAGQLRPARISELVSLARSYDSSLSESDLWTPNANLSAVDLAALGEKGASILLHEGADRLKQHASTMTQVTTASVLHSGNSLAPAMYFPNASTHAHLQRACTAPPPCNPWISACPKPAWCDSVGIAWGATTAAVGIIIQQCTQNPLAFAFCGTLGSEIAALGLSVLDIAVWGILIGGLILLIVCT